MAGVTNISRGPRFVYASGEPVLLNAGETRDFDLRDHEVKNVQQQVDAGVLAWDGEAPQAKGADLTPADLLAKVDEMPFLAFRSAAAKILGPEAPTTKAELVAALQAKAGA